MSSVREVWLAIRETVFTVAQVVTLGVVALVLGLIALTMLLSRPGSNGATAARRPLSELVPTIVAASPTAGAPRDAVREPTLVASPMGLYQPPGLAPRENLPAAATEPPATATPLPAPPEPPAHATATPRPAAPTPSPRPAAPTATAAAATPTSNPTSQMMKVLPASDGLPARVRSEPNTKSRILVRVPLGAQVEVVGSAQGDEIQPGNRVWFKIRFRNVTGYIYSPLLDGG
ncbi:MAG: SH3 domain-containing protein [Chloroflexota bacterium]|nr:MAG: SH3 domain-containing protein [Chloroflexota bacterium]